MLWAIPKHFSKLLEILVTHKKTQNLQEISQLLEASSWRSWKGIGRKEATSTTGQKEVESSSQYLHSNIWCNRMNEEVELTFTLCSWQLNNRKIHAQHLPAKCLAAGSNQRTELQVNKFQSWDYFSLILHWSGNVLNMILDGCLKSWPKSSLSDQLQVVTFTRAERDVRGPVKLN